MPRDTDPQSGKNDDDALDDSLINALESVELYAKMHLRLVPNEPHDHQCAAGAAAGDISPAQARAVYRAMLAANEI